MAIKEHCSACSRESRWQNAQLRRVLAPGFEFAPPPSRAGAAAVVSQEHRSGVEEDSTEETHSHRREEEAHKSR